MLKKKRHPAGWMAAGMPSEAKVRAEDFSVLVRKDGHHGVYSVRRTKPRRRVVH